MTPPTPSPAPQRLGATYPPYPFWAWTCSRNPEVAEDKGQWHRLAGPLPRGRSWPFYYWLPDQPEKPTCDPRTTPLPAPQQWADKAADEIFAIHVETGLTGRCEDVAAIITKHAAAISEENERLRREVEEARSAMRARDNIGMSREEYHKAKKALEENETLRVHLASERQAKIERGDMFIELQAQYAAAQEWQNGVWGALRVALPDYDEIKEPAHEAIARLANYLDTSQKESLCFRKEISALWSRVASAEKARDEARAAVESSRSRFAELIALAYMPAADPSAKLHSRTWKDECAAHSKHADALAGIARDFRAQLTALRQWSEQAREALERITKIPPRGQGDAVEMECIARNALLQSHPAETNLTEEGK